MDWTTFAAGAFCGSLLFDLLWRVTHSLTLTLIEEQKELIDEQRKLTDSVYQLRGRL